MRILIINNSAWGTYNFRLNLARSLREKNFEVLFLFPFDTFYTPKIKEEFECKNIKLSERGLNPIEEVGTIFSLYRNLRRIQPSIIISFTVKPNLYALILQPLFSYKSFVSITGMGSLYLEQRTYLRLIKIFYEKILDKATMIFCQNSTDFNFLSKNLLINTNKITLTPGSGVDLVRFSPSEKKDQSKPKIFLMIARVIREKGIIEYIDAIKIFRKNNPNNQVEFWLVGKYDQKNTPGIDSSLFQNWVNSNIFIYFEHTDSIEDFIKKVDCVVLPSYREGLPRSILEAGAMGKPSIVSNVPGCADIIKDGYNGLIVDSKSASSLAKTFSKFCSLEQSLIDLMGKNARKNIVKNFDEKIVLRKYNQAIEKANVI